MIIQLQRESKMWQQSVIYCENQFELLLEVKIEMIMLLEHYTSMVTLEWGVLLIRLSANDVWIIYTDL